VKEPRSLVVEGIQVREVEALAWSPTDLSFVDLSTGNAEGFMVERSQAAGIAKFAITG
jgi:hypothetical protein